MKTIFTYLILFILSLLPFENNISKTHNHYLSASAITAETDNVYSLSTSSISQVSQSSSYNILYVYSSNLENINSLSIEIHFTSSNITITNIYNNVTSLMYDSSIQNDTAKVTYLFDGTSGTNNKTLLFYFYYSVKDDATIGDDYFDILVTEAYDSSLNSVEFNNVRASFKIKAKETTKHCYIYSNLSGNNAKINEIISVNYYTYTYDIESASFVITYDEEFLSFDSLEKGTYLNDKIVDINSSYKGSIYISFVSTTTTYNSNLFTIKFKVKKNTNIATNIELTPSELYDGDLNIISSSKVTNTLNLIEDENYTADKPSIRLSSNYDSSTNQISLKATLDKDMHLGAGDFTISYEAENITYASYKKLFSPSFFNVNDKDATNGKLKFSIINLTDIVDETEVIEIIFTPKLYCEKSYEIKFDITGSGIADSLTNYIVINYVNCSESITKTNHPNLTHHEKVDATCTTSGTIEYYSCDDCGKKFKDITKNEEVTDLSIEKLGHSYGEWITSIEATCTKEGKLVHKCESCGVEEYKTVPALGHDYQKQTTEATCTTDGSITYVCSRCNEVDDSKTTVLKATGHSYGEWIIDKEATDKEDGLEHRTCNYCNDKEEKIIPKLKNNNSLIIIISVTTPLAIIALIGLIIILVKKKNKML